jgi:hypothetical protein
LKNQGAYTWIQLHTTVETDHFEAAVAGANSALKYYVGCASMAKSWILDGFSRFATVQGQFMRSLPGIIPIKRRPSPILAPKVMHPIACGCATG